MTLTGSIKLDLQNLETRKLFNVKFLKRDGSASFPITFASPFSSQPAVHLGLIGFDGGGEGFRFRFEPEQVTETGFNIVLEARLSWINNIEVSWLATDA